MVTMLGDSGDMLDLVQPRHDIPVIRRGPKGVRERWDGTGWVPSPYPVLPAPGTEVIERTTWEDGTTVTEHTYTLRPVSARVCADCGDGFEWVITRGPGPARCEPCRKRRRQIWSNGGRP